MSEYIDYVETVKGAYIYVSRRGNVSVDGEPLPSITTLAPNE